ncbi:CPBP family intramembrane glutamic endopeptidase [Streptococcus sanguinis]|uniref:CPBP family intramembrane glutamic endopeptidase n=1 Tax=Streptococcus sanguinis TaxID=1305 RepID=UPI001CBC0D9E|nr:type II CAAX endopeptidase family protein [Streptococcus sanguinis]MBZ2021736.1 CPBP family intramembrane metalloprotease [Streptococcus sanguinis]MBZ2073583.1 CPBP family intramembrane metalloprotease [Streptococcus sanguinis]MBZ2081507.1 CPBP family intramembrane metalloprotease [Streptococcus sanguinis]MCC3166229.1 CAAX protease self-immunity family protein [Streptococcus sanguinis]
MNIETTIKPQPKLILPFLAWNFGWTWGFLLTAILLKNLWLENPPTAYLVFEGIVASLAFFGPLVASLIVLKVKGFNAIFSFIFSGRKGTWLYLLIFSGGMAATFALAAGGRIEGSILAGFVGSFLYLTIMAGGIEEPGWRGFLQPALEQKFSFPLASAITGIIWAVWHLPLWFYDRVADRSQDPFLIYLVFCIILSVWLAALYKKTKSVIACDIFHALYDILVALFIGISQAYNLDFSQANPLFFLGGVAVLTLYSIYLWYRTDKEEKYLTDDKKE